MKQKTHLEKLRERILKTSKKNQPMLLLQYELQNEAILKDKPNNPLTCDTSEYTPYQAYNLALNDWKNVIKKGIIK